MTGAAFAALVMPIAPAVITAIMSERGRFMSATSNHRVEIEEAAIRVPN
jgi:hypothetical protein